MHILIQITNLVITSLTVILQPNHYEQIYEDANLILSPSLVTFLQPTSTHSTSSSMSLTYKLSCSLKGDTVPKMSFVRFKSNTHPEASWEKRVFPDQLVIGPVPQGNLKKLNASSK